MLKQTGPAESGDSGAVSGEFLDIDGERYYAIRHVDEMPPFFVSVVSDDDHWLFVSSTGGLTAGRVSPGTALFPYVPVDRVHESAPHTGSLTVFRIGPHGKQQIWEPFNRAHDGRYAVERNLYKNLLGNKLRFEEVNHDLGLAFAYTWSTSDRFGFVRQCELRNTGDRAVRLDLLDGLQNILPAGTPQIAQTNSSNLVDAYKWTELDESTGLGIFALYSGISDRAEPAESLKANTVFSLGLPDATVLLSSSQVTAFRAGERVRPEAHKRGIRGAYLVSTTLELPPGETAAWQLVANLEQSQSAVVELRSRLAADTDLAEEIDDSVERGSDELARIMGSADGFQMTAEENVATHHYANVLFNILRGGIFDDQYRIPMADLARTLESFNKAVYERHAEWLESMDGSLDIADLRTAIDERGDTQLSRLCLEYLPITFGRRHGDPSRPWNRFAIRLRDQHGDRLLSYEGNWRDIFQNWEALAFSYPEFVESIIAKFVNASTMDGYNPYRITKQGIDWEIEEPDDPWSYIGYWGDHQIIYLLKLLELSYQFHPTRLSELLLSPVFSYANVPYRIRPFESLVRDPKNTVDYDHALEETIEARVAEIGADGKLVFNGDGRVYQVNLLEKLLVPLLAKLGNLVIDGGIWMNTQRPEWNDANNALVGNGLSMVTLFYMRRYLEFLLKLLEQESGNVHLSTEVADWVAETAETLAGIQSLPADGPIDAEQRYAALEALGSAASHYRARVYEHDGFTGSSETSLDSLRSLLEDALTVVDHTIGVNRREDGLFNAYNLLVLDDGRADIDVLYPMLEGQVAALSARALSAEDALAVLDALYDSDIYREDQHSFMLYPDRPLKGFLEKNRVEPDAVGAIPLLSELLAKDDDSIVTRDLDGHYRFNADFSNAGDLDQRLDAVARRYGAISDEDRAAIRQLYEDVFNHRAFTGRSGGMFGFEGLGCIYWHMVSKLLLAVQENFFDALASGADAASVRGLGDMYYRIRAGIGFNKTPTEYGAFPTDPYSHTPGHAGARQPGMTGQVKEEVLTRFGELGIRVYDGQAHVVPSLLRSREFLRDEHTFRYLDTAGNWQQLEVPAGGLAFTWAGVPILYRLGREGERSLVVTRRDGSTSTSDTLALSAADSRELFGRSGAIRQITVTLTTADLFGE